MLAACSLACRRDEVDDGNTGLEERKKCKYIYIYVYIYTYMYIYIYVYIYICI